MTDFGRFPGFRISDAPPTYSPVLMYLEIQVFAGFPELKTATFANTFRCFEISGNPGFVRFPAAPNRDFREYVLLFRCTWKYRFCEASRSSSEEIPPFWSTGKSNFSRLQRTSSRILMARDFGDAACQIYPRIGRSVSGPPVRPIRAFRVGMAGSAELETGASRTKFHRFMVRK